MKRKVWFKMTDLDHEFFEGSVSGLIEKLKKIEEQYPKYCDFTIEAKGSYDGRHLELIGFREESDEEYQKRLHKEKRAEELKKQNKINQIKQLEEKIKKLNEEL